MRPALTDYQHLASGKVRELYRIDADHLLFVASDRISAFDYILDTTIPDKGRILTAMSVFFFDFSPTGAPNHLAGPADDERIPDEVLGRALVVRELEMVPVECVARGYLTGSGLIDYREDGRVCGIELPPGLTEASKFAEPLFTPASKAELGDHDENISFADVVDLVGAERAAQLRDPRCGTYAQAAEHALSQGDHHRGHQVRIRGRRAAAIWCWPTRCSPPTRRGTGSRRLPGRCRAAQLRQAVRPQLADRARLGLGPCRRRAAARPAAGHRRSHSEPLHRSVRTCFRIEVRRLDRSQMTGSHPSPSASTIVVFTTATSSSTHTSGCATSPIPR